MNNIVIHLGSSGDKIILPLTEAAYEIIRSWVIYKREQRNKNVRDVAVELSKVDGVTAKNELGVKFVNGHLVVSSRDVAKAFRKAHYHVLRDIKKLDCSSDFRETNFGFSQYKVEGNNRTYEECMITRDGFTFLVMGYTGERAARFKQRYIEAFNAMEKQLKEQQIELPF